MGARLAQSVEHQTFNLRAMGSSPISGDQLSFFNFTLLKTYQFFLSKVSSVFDKIIEVKV